MSEKLLVILLACRLLILCKSRLLHRQTQIRRPLKHRQARRLLRTLLCNLDARRSSANDSDLLARNIHIFFWPKTRMMHRPFKGVQTLPIWKMPLCRKTRRKNEILASSHFAIFASHNPLLFFGIPLAAHDRGVKVDIFLNL